MERKALVKYVLSPFMSVVSRQVVENCSQARDHDKVILKVASQQPLRKSYLRVLFLAPKKTLVFLKCVDLQRYSETNN